jgi:hypothetical protein
VAGMLNTLPYNLSSKKLIAFTIRQNNNIYNIYYQS